MVGVRDGKGKKTKSRGISYFTSLSGLLDNAELENTGDAAFEGVYTYIYRSGFFLLICGVAFAHPLEFNIYSVLRFVRNFLICLL